jgi:hypothetical protein
MLPETFRWFIAVPELRTLLSVAVADLSHEARLVGPGEFQSWYGNRALFCRYYVRAFEDKPSFVFDANALRLSGYRVFDRFCCYGEVTARLDAAVLPLMLNWKGTNWGSRRLVISAASIS